MFNRIAPAFAAGAIFAVLVAGTGAYAATGGSFILGHTNTASKITTLTSSGTALSVKSQHGPALAVNNDARVANLNADKLDGQSAGSFASARAKTGSHDAGGTELDLDGNGLVDAIAGYAECPAGSQMTGGGGGDFTATGYLLTSAPDPDGYEAWLFAVGVSENYSEDPTSVFASVTCWDPTGNQPSGTYRSGARPLPAHALKLLERAAPSRR